MYEKDHNEAYLHQRNRSYFDSYIEHRNKPIDSPIVYQNYLH